ncbi:unnamed protein product, partial [Symbiodinium sp. KB8]
ALDAWLRRHSASQVVQLAVGCDTRALRLGHPGAMWFEVDTPRVAAFRQRFFSANYRAVQLGVDLTGGPISLCDALVEAGFRRDLPTAWICEGLFEYHEEAFADRLLAEIGGLSGVGDQMLLLAVLDLYWLQYLKEQHAQKPVRLAWKPGRLPGLQKVSARIAAHGWQLQEVTSEMRLAEPILRDGAQVKSLFHVLRASDSKIGGDRMVALAANVAMHAITVLGREECHVYRCIDLDFVPTTVFITAVACLLDDLCHGTREKESRSTEMCARALRAVA